MVVFVICVNVGDGSCNKMLALKKSKEMAVIEVLQNNEK